MNKNYKPRNINVTTLIRQALNALDRELTPSMRLRYLKLLAEELRDARDRREARKAAKELKQLQARQKAAEQAAAETPPTDAYAL